MHIGRREKCEPNAVLVLPASSSSVVVLVAQSCPTLCNPMDYIAHQVPLSMGFSRQEHWSRLSFQCQQVGGL